METIVKKNQEMVYGENELKKLILEFVSETEKVINEKNYHLSDKSNDALKALSSVDWKSYMSNTSKKSKKRINRMVSRFKKKPSLQNMNRGFHFIHTRILSKRELIKSQYSWFSYYKWTAPDFIDKVVIEHPLAHQQIQKCRQEWKKAQKISDELHDEYILQKGDYYKTK